MCTTCGGTDPLDAERQAADAVEDAFTRAKRDRHDVKAKLVDRAQRQVLVRVAAPPAIANRPSPAARSACARADSGPSVTNVNVVPPSISSGSR
jgi:hypothetical protein